MFSFSDSHCSDFNELLTPFSCCENKSFNVQELTDDNIEEHYSIFMRESWLNRPTLLAKLEKLNKIFAEKYDDFPGLEFGDLLLDSNNE